MENTKTKFTVGELYQLHNELAGTQETPGLLSEKLPLTTKYHLTKLAKSAQQHKQNFEDLRTELIKALGTPSEDGQSYSLPEFIEGERNENHTSFVKQLNELLVCEEEIDVPNLTIEDFSTLETNNFYPMLFKVLGA